MIHAIRHAAVPRRTLIFAVAVTVASSAAWMATGSRGYTSLTSLDVVAFEPEEDDPLAGTGFYDDSAQTVRETRGFHLGLLPAPRSIVDVHLLSLLTLLILAWAPFSLIYARASWRARCRSGSCMPEAPGIPTEPR